MKNIPGGMMRCANDSMLTLLAMSDGFFAMFGYTREDIRILFGDKFINMVHPGDRPVVLKKVRDQLSVGSELELEYRVLRKVGPPVWILDRGRLLDDEGKKTFYGLLLEINERKKEQEELRLTLERHQVIMDQTTDIIFEWDIVQDTLSFSPNWRKKFGYEPIHKHISRLLPRSGNIHSEDMSAFLKIMKDTAAGIPYSEAEFRIGDSAGRYLWYKIRATAQYNDDHQPIKAVGVIIDIDVEKKHKQALLDQAQRDALTGLYNKAAVNKLVEQRMLEKSVPTNQALMIIDVDRFKDVNDIFGHLCGDSVLSDVAAILKGCIRSTDFAGRIGGDEFLVYLPEIPDEKTARLKANSIMNALHSLKPEKAALPITCSIGAAVCPRNSVDYLMLYKRADLALYRQKNSGRNGFFFYSPELCSGEIPCDPAATAVGASIVSDDGNVSDEHLSQYVFRMLYEAKALEPALPHILEIVGRAHDVNRVFIYEKQDGVAVVTFEWHRDGTLPGKAVPKTVLFDQDGVFYCPKRLVQNAGAVFLSAIRDGEEFFGGVGFEGDENGQPWTRSQLAAFKLTSNVIATFVLKLRIKQRLKQLTGK